MMVGAPGTGKSYFARLLAERTGAVIIQTDAIRKELFAHPSYTPREHAIVYREAHRRIAEALARGDKVVFDATNLYESKRRILYRLADQAGARLVIVVTYAPPEVVFLRLEGRAKRLDPADLSDADWSIYVQMRQKMEPIRRDHWVVNTTVRMERALGLVSRDVLAPVLTVVPGRVGVARGQR